VSSKTRYVRNVTKEEKTRKKNKQLLGDLKEITGRGIVRNCSVEKSL
jgi:hypothetical protein